MRKLRTRQMALVLSLAAVAAAGCGSSSSSKSTPKSPAASTPATPSTPSTGTTTTPTTGFAAQLNTVCMQFKAAFAKASTPAEKITVFNTYADKFNALQPSAAEKADYNKFKEAINAEVAAAKANDQAALMKANEQGVAAGKALGVPDCTN